MSARRWIGAAAVLAATAVIAPPRAARAAEQVSGMPSQQQQRESDLNALLQRDLQQLAAKLTDNAARQEERDEAARRLVSRQTPEARKIIADTLASVNPAAQVAVARALMDDPQPDPTLINPLFATLGVNRVLTEASARALANYKTNSEVLTRLIDFVRRRPPNDLARIAVIQSIGTVPNRRAAEFLISVLASPDESPTARREAAAALGDLTGVSENGQDPAQWQRWWDVNGRKSDDQFAADLLARRSARYDQIKQSFTSLSAELEKIVNEQYRLAPAAQRADVLLGFLRSAEADVRAAGASIVKFDALGGRPPSAAVKEQLRELIGDSSAKVRLAVADALPTINDAEAFEPVMAQLAQESNADVRRKLATALGPIEDVRAAPLLVAILDDPSAAAAGAAADSLAQLGKTIRESDPALALRAGRALLKTMETRATGPDAAEFRAKLVSAMAPLKLDELGETFKRLLDARLGEDAQVRKLALRGLGELANPQYVAIIVASMNDSAEAVRIEALEALAKNPAIPNQAETLRPRLDPQEERSEAVREAAWNALTAALPELPKDQLAIWAERFKNDPQKRVVVLRDLADQQLKDRDEDGLATTRINTAQVYMELGDPAAAAEYFRLALEYKKSRGITGAAIDSLIDGRLVALLKAKDYATAASFGAQMIRENNQNQQTVGRIIVSEAERLADARENKSASELVAQANKMDPPLAEPYRDRLREVEQKLGAQNNATGGLGPTSSTAASDRDSVSSPAR